MPSKRYLLYLVGFSTVFSILLAYLEITFPNARLVYYTWSALGTIIVFGSTYLLLRRMVTGVEVKVFNTIFLACLVFVGAVAAINYSLYPRFEEYVFYCVMGIFFLFGTYSVVRDVFNQPTQAAASPRSTVRQQPRIITPEVVEETHGTQQPQYHRCGTCRGRGSVFGGLFSISCWECRGTGVSDM